MTFEQIQTYLTGLDLGDRIYTFEQSSATVELAALAVGCEPCKIAKTMSFMVSDAPILVVLAGDARISNPKFKAQFSQKAKMISPEVVADLTGFPVGGVCPFMAPNGVKVYLDESLKRFDVVYPAAGTRSSAVKLSIEELEQASKADGWVDISKLPEADA
ncbi:MAG: YbaK/EbsC family protein [Clostridiales bacterium]|nr:YbaK/EbsC family protein [Clostridiales bacterium]